MLQKLFDFVHLSRPGYKYVTIIYTSVILYIVRSLRVPSLLWYHHLYNSHFQLSPLYLCRTVE